jgi:hypothetical protein
MAREQLVFNYVATEYTAPNLKNASTIYHYSIKLMDPPICPTELRYERWMRDATRMQWFAKGYGYTQTPAYWEAIFEIDGAWITVMNYLNAFGWTQSGLINKMEDPNVS